MTAAESRAKIEEITDDVPATAPEAGAEAAAEDDDEEVIKSGSGVTIHNRYEKKARKLIAKLNLKRVDGISRVFLKRNRGIAFTIADPEVFVNPATGTYVVFGEAKVDNQSANMAAQLANMQQQAAAAGGADAAAPKDPNSIQKDLEAAVASTSLDDKAEDADEEDADAEGLDEQEIKLVMEQGNVSRNKAIAGLKRNKGDVVNTIMDVTK